MDIIRNIKDCYKHIPYTMRHKKAILDVQEQLTGKRTYYLHDIDKLFMYLFFPYIGTKLIHRIHSKFAKHHITYHKGLDKVDIAQAICDYESARFTKPDKPLNAVETIEKYYPQYKEYFEEKLKELKLK